MLDSRETRSLSVWQLIADISNQSKITELAADNRAINDA